MTEQKEPYQYSELMFYIIGESFFEFHFSRAMLVPQEVTVKAGKSLIQYFHEGTLETFSIDEVKSILPQFKANLMLALKSEASTKANNDKTILRTGNSYLREEQSLLISTLNLFSSTEEEQIKALSDALTKELKKATSSTQTSLDVLNDGLILYGYQLNLSNPNIFEQLQTIDAQLKNISIHWKVDDISRDTILSTTALIQALISHHSLTEEDKKILVVKYGEAATDDEVDEITELLIKHIYTNHCNSFDKFVATYKCITKDFSKVIKDSFLQYIAQKEQIDTQTLVPRVEFLNNYLISIDKKIADTKDELLKFTQPPNNNSAIEFINYLTEKVDYYKHIKNNLLDYLAEFTLLKTVIESAQKPSMELIKKVYSGFSLIEEKNSNIRKVLKNTMPIPLQEIDYLIQAVRNPSVTNIEEVLEKSKKIHLQLSESSSFLSEIEEEFINIEDIYTALNAEFTSKDEVTPFIKLAKIMLEKYKLKTEKYELKHYDLAEEFEGRIGQMSLNMTEAFCYIATANNKKRKQIGDKEESQLPASKNKLQKETENYSAEPVKFAL